MAMDPDYGIWKQVSTWLWTLLAIPVAGMWRRLENSATKEEIAHIIRTIDSTNTEWRETARTMFANADADRKLNNERFMLLLEKLHASENSSRDAHVALINQVHSAAIAANAASATAAALLASSHNIRS